MYTGERCTDQLTGPIPRLVAAARLPRRHLVLVWSLASLSRRLRFREVVAGSAVQCRNKWQYVVAQVDISSPKEKYLQGRFIRWAANNQYNKVCPWIWFWSASCRAPKWILNQALENFTSCVKCSRFTSKKMSGWKIYLLCKYSKMHVFFFFFFVYFPFYMEATLRQILYLL